MNLYRMLFRLSTALAISVILLSSSGLRAQTDSLEAEMEAMDNVDSISVKAFSLQSVFREVVDSIAGAEIFKNREKKIYSRQLQTLSSLQKQYFDFEEYFSRSIDTSKTTDFLNTIKDEYVLAVQGTLDLSSSVTIRDLSTTRLILDALIKESDSKKGQLVLQLKRLEEFRSAVDSLETDSMLYYFAKDSALFVQYFGKLMDVNKETSRLDSTLNACIFFNRNAVEKINRLQAKFTQAEQGIQRLRVEKSQNIFSPESAGLLSAVGSGEPLGGVLNYSLRKSGTLLKDYLINHVPRIVLTVFAFLILLLLVRMVKRNLTDHSRFESEVSCALLNRPVITSIFLTLVYMNFMFPRPPAVFQGIVWTILSILLILIIWHVLKGRERLNLIIFTSGFMVTVLSDLILKETPAERWILLIFSMAGIVMFGGALRKHENQKGFRLTRRIVLILSMLLMAASFASNLLGSYNLSKLLISFALYMPITGYVLIWAVRLTSELIRLYATGTGSDEDSLHYAKAHSLARSFPRKLTYIITVGWIFLLVRNFYLFEQIVDSIAAFMKYEYEIGDFTFSFEKFFLFLFILALSTIISKVISFFADSGESGKSTAAGGGGISNWMLLIRIAVMSIGILLAFAATGIPIDKLTIIIGSLGVGIGLGLQNIVGNLVSGVLLAFEKPFRIGDEIEVDKNLGKIKGIGIRSSQLATPDGADVIIPNGDLLSKHVKNWTLRNMRKRTEFNQKIDIGGHVEEITEQLAVILEGNEKIKSDPKPKVLLFDFGSDFSEYKLSYWTDIHTSDDVRNEIVSAIEKGIREFKSNEEQGKPQN